MGASSRAGMANVLSDEKKQQVLALGRLGWSLRKIEAATGIRRETASAYLRAASIATLIASVYGIAQYFDLDPLQNPAGYHAQAGDVVIVRPPGTMGHADYFGWWLVVAGFCAVAQARIDEGVWRSVGIAAAADLEPQAYRAVQGDDGPAGGGGRPKRPGAGGANPGVGGQVHDPVRAGSGTPSRHGAAPRSDGRSRSNGSITACQTGFAALEFFPPRRVSCRDARS